MGEFLQVVKTIASSDGGAAVVTAAIVWFVFWTVAKFVRMSTKHDSFERTCDQLNARVEKIESGMHEVKGDIQYIKSTLNTIVNMVQTSNQALMKSHSPLALTEFGEKMAAGIGVDEILARDFATIKAKIDAEVTTKTPYDVQTYCLEKIPVFPENYLDADALSSIKTYAFNNGRTLFECLKVVGLKARDAYFKATGLI